MTLPPLNIARIERQVQCVGLVRTALYNGRLVRPDTCFGCGRVVPVEAHHEDYDKPYDVWWLCRKCHVSYHRFGVLGLVDSVCCPRCGSPVVRSGVQVTNLAGDKKQVYKCVGCCHRTVNPRSV